jgi:hypothetical protein
MDSTDQEKTLIQKVYPTVNNEDLLEFRIPANVKANMCLSNVMLRFVVKIPQVSGQNLIPENLLGAKQFSSVEIRLNGDAVSRRSCANEYYLSSYFQYLSNFSADYACTSCMTFGIFDSYQISSSTFQTDKNLTDTIVSARKGVNDDYIYEIVMPIESSVFSSNQNLPTNTPIDISFERLSSKFSSISSKSEIDLDALPKIFTLEDAYLLVPFTNDSELLQMEKQAISRPIKLKFDDYVINRFNIPKDSPNIRLSNVISGPLPETLFWGIMDLSGFAGSFNLPSCHFKRFGLKKCTLYLNGNAMSGFPILTSESAVSIPYTRFLKNTNRYLNCYSSQTIDPRDFKNYHFVNSASLDSETSGSLSFDFDFENTPSEDLVLITCGIFDRTMEIDNFRNFKIL